MAESPREHEDDEIGTESFAEMPLVISVELASVALAQRQWGAVTEGESIATGYTVGAPVTLRLHGKPVALGELCVSGDQVVVRIIKKYTGGTP